MYIAIVILLLFVLPVSSISVELLVLNSAVDPWFLVGKWFVLWAVGVRLFMAGLKQTTKPEFTAKRIFEIESPDVFVVIRELGFANLSMGLLGLSSIFKPEWVMPAAIVGGLYYGLAGVGHFFKKQRN